MKNGSRPLLNLSAAALLGTAAAVASAQEEGTAKILAPWESEGTVYQIAVDQILFQGRAQGIMYIDTGKGALDGAVFVCPSTNRIDLKNETSEVKGHCLITGGEEGELVFAEFECKGEVGRCDGKLEFTGGTGQFEGITGSGKMQVRTTLVGLAADMTSGEVLRDAAGLAVWPELKYKIPGK